MCQHFRWRRWGSSLPGLRTLDPPLSPPSTPAEFFRRTCLGGEGKFLEKLQAILSTFCLFFDTKKLSTPTNCSFEVRGVWKSWPYVIRSLYLSSKTPGFAKWASNNLFAIHQIVFLAADFFLCFWLSFFLSSLPPCLPSPSCPIWPCGAQTSCD